MFKQNDATVCTYDAGDIIFLRSNSYKNTNIHIESGHSREIPVNYMLACHFWQRSRITGESFDLRAICALKTDDEFYNVYRNPEADIAIKKALAARVKIINPFDIY